MLSEETVSPVGRKEAQRAPAGRPPDPERRRILKGAAFAILGAAGTLLAVPLAGMLLSPVRRKTRSLLVPIGPVERYEGPEPVSATYTFRQRQAWLERDVTRGVYVITTPTGEPAVLSARCTHLGCQVQWQASAQQFRCPCHGGCFDREGRRVAGPPPRPLVRLASSVRDGILYVEEPAEV
jgi:Rieske Fe-S protein